MSSDITILVYKRKHIKGPVRVFLFGLVPYGIPVQ